MAKRTNPFVEDFVPQSKVHIGMKQFNNNHDRLKQVYGMYPPSTYVLNTITKIRNEAYWHII